MSIFITFFDKKIMEPYDLKKIIIIMIFTVITFLQ